MDRACLICVLSTRKKYRGRCFPDGIMFLAECNVPPGLNVWNCIYGCRCNRDQNHCRALDSRLRLSLNIISAGATSPRSCHKWMDLWGSTAVRALVHLVAESICFMRPSTPKLWLYKIWSWRIIWGCNGLVSEDCATGPEMWPTKILPRRSMLHDIRQRVLHADSVGCTCGRAYTCCFVFEESVGLEDLWAKQKGGCNIHSKRRNRKRHENNSPWRTQGARQHSALCEWGGISAEKRRPEQHEHTTRLQCSMATAGMTILPVGNIPYYDWLWGWYKHLISERLSHETDPGFLTIHVFFTLTLTYRWRFQRYDTSMTLFRLVISIKGTSAMVPDNQRQRNIRIIRSLTTSTKQSTRMKYQTSLSIMSESALIILYPC